MALDEDDYRMLKDTLEDIGSALERIATALESPVPFNVKVVD